MAIEARAIKAEQFYTVEQFEQMPEFSGGFELIDGKVIAKPMTTIQHGRIARRIINSYYDFDRDEKIGEVVAGDVNVRLANDYAPAPDISFWKAENRPKDGAGAAPRPDLAIEIWSDSDLNTKKKREEARAKLARYFDAGVLLVWAINPDNQTVEIHRPDQTTPEVLDINAELSGENVIPGFKFAINKLFE